MDIKELRLGLKLSQEEFARRLGISTSAIQKWESGVRTPGRLATREIERLMAKAGIKVGKP